MCILKNCDKPPEPHYKGTNDECDLCLDCQHLMQAAMAADRVRRAADKALQQGLILPEEHPDA